MSRTIEGALMKNNIGRWEVNGLEFTSGSCLEILLDSKWIRGVIEYCHPKSAYCFYTKFEGIPVSLFKGITARVTMN